MAQLTRVDILPVMGIDLWLKGARIRIRTLSNPVERNVTKAWESALNVSDMGPRRGHSPPCFVLETGPPSRSSSMPTGITPEPPSQNDRNLSVVIARLARVYCSSHVKWAERCGCWLGLPIMVGQGAEHTPSRIGRGTRHTVHRDWSGGARTGSLARLWVV